MKNQYGTSVGFIQHPEGKKVNQMTLGEVKQWGRQLIEQTRGRKDLGLPEHLGSSAKGAYQMNNDFLEDWAGDLYGDDYQDVVFNKDTQDSIMRNYLDKVEPKRVYSNFEGLKKAGVTPDKIASLNDEDIMYAIRATETGSGLEDGWLESRLNKSPENASQTPSQPAPEGLAASFTSVVPSNDRIPVNLNNNQGRNPQYVASDSAVSPESAARREPLSKTKDVEFLSYDAPVMETEGLAAKAKKEEADKRKQKLSNSFNNLFNSLSQNGLAGNVANNTPTKTKKISSNSRLHF